MGSRGGPCRDSHLSFFPSTSSFGRTRIDSFFRRRRLHELSINKTAQFRCRIEKMNSTFASTIFGTYYESAYQISTQVTAFIRINASFRRREINELRNGTRGQSVPLFNLSPHPQLLKNSTYVPEIPHHKYKLVVRARRVFTRAYSRIFSYVILLYEKINVRRCQFLERTRPDDTATVNSTAVWQPFFCFFFPKHPTTVLIVDRRRRRVYFGRLYACDIAIYIVKISEMMKNHRRRRRQQFDIGRKIPAARLTTTNIGTIPYTGARKGKGKNASLSRRWQLYMFGRIPIQILKSECIRLQFSAFLPFLRRHLSLVRGPHLLFTRIMHALRRSDRFRLFSVISRAPKYRKLGTNADFAAVK